MSETPQTDAMHKKLVKISEGPDWIAGKDYVEMKKHSSELETKLTQHAKIMEAMIKHEQRERMNNWHDCVVCQVVREAK